MERSQGGDWISRIVKSELNEVEGWNTIELTVRADSATHAVNGKTNNRCWAISQPDPSDQQKFVPLRKGRILLQAEGAEIMYRNIEIGPLQ
ncbi:MAG TPA: family 16 glycoside hydrolase [Acidobacteriota bacterium]